MEIVYANYLANVFVMRVLSLYETYFLTGNFTSRTLFSCTFTVSLKSERDVNSFKINRASKKDENINKIKSDYIF